MAAIVRTQMGAQARDAACTRVCCRWSLRFSADGYAVVVTLSGRATSEFAHERAGRLKFYAADTRDAT